MGSVHPPPWRKNRRVVLRIGDDTRENISVSCPYCPVRSYFGSWGGCRKQLGPAHPRWRPSQDKRTSRRLGRMRRSIWPGWERAGTPVPGVKDR
jgi:hypothetical protein